MLLTLILYTENSLITNDSEPDLELCLLIRVTILRDVIAASLITHMPKPLEMNL